MIQNVKEFFKMIADNWILCIGIVILVYSIFDIIRNLIKYNDIKKIQNTIHKISGVIAEYVYEAEIKYIKKHIIHAGVVKRAEVISKIYEKYPELSKYINQELIIEKIDELINKVLDEIQQIEKDDNKPSQTKK